jgi:hypothetical protein
MNVTEMNKLQDYYWNEVVQETDEFASMLWQKFEKLKEDNTNSLGQKWKVRTSYNESESYADFDGSAYAQGGRSGFKNLYVPYRTVSRKQLFTKEAIDQDDAKAKYHPLVQEMNQLRTGAFKQLNRAIALGDGSARIGVLTANYSGGTATQLTLAPGTGFGNKGAQFIKPGKKVNIYSATGSTLRNGTIGGEGILTVSTVNKTTGVVTFTSNAPSDAVIGDIIAPERSGARGINGLEYWVANSGNLFDLSRSTDPGLQSVMVDGSSGALLLLVETMFSALAHYIEEDAALGINGEGKGEFTWSPTQREKYRKECLGLGITMLGSDKIDAGYGHNEEVNGYKFNCYKDHSNTKIHYLRFKDWYRIARGNAEKPFQVIPFMGQDMASTYDSSARDASGFFTNIGAYVNVACRNVRNQAAIFSLPTSGLQTGNV